MPVARVNWKKKVSQDGKERKDSRNMVHELQDLTVGFLVCSTDGNSEIYI